MTGNLSIRLRAKSCIRDFWYLPLMVALLSGVGRAQQVPADTGSSLDWCATERLFEQRNPSSTQALAGCPTRGECDLAASRNANIPTATQPFITIRLMLHIVARDDGSSPAATPDKIPSVIEHLTQDYLPVRVNFEYQYDYIYSTKYRSLSQVEEDSLKIATAVQPDSMLNVWVTYTEGNYSYGTFPWDTRSLTSLGGIILTEFHFDPSTSAFAHEVGHCLGLWHTHHGVSEVTKCSPCYERANSPDGDITGDFCEDTDPTPLNRGCTPPPGTDSCTGTSWGPTDVQNYMGYSGDGCWSEFSPQQWGRMHCWMDAKLRSWMAGVRFTATQTLGPAPLQVGFTGITSKNVSAWAWNFGDGQSSNQQAPAHLYTQPGLFDVNVHIESDAGPYESIRRNLIWVYADTLLVDSVPVGPGQQVKVSISARNYLPVTGMTIPFIWNGPADLTLDSVSTQGLRTAYLGDQGFLSVDDYNKRAAFRMRAAQTEAQPPLAPGSGPVLNLYFHVSGVSGATNPVVIVGYSTVFSTYEPTFESAGGSYTPANRAGAVLACLAGDINGDFIGPDLSDLSTLIAYLLGGISALPNPTAGNVDGKGTIDLSDLSYLILYLLAGGPSPQCGA